MARLAHKTTINGTVVDGDGLPILGANVLIVGTTEGTTSDFDGNFTLTTDLSGSQTLRVSFIGFTTFEQTVELNGSDITLDVVLQESGQQLERWSFRPRVPLGRKRTPRYPSAPKTLKRLPNYHPAARPIFYGMFLGSPQKVVVGKPQPISLYVDFLLGGNMSLTPSSTMGCHSPVPLALTPRPMMCMPGQILALKAWNSSVEVLLSFLVRAQLPGLINYTSKTGDTNPGNIINMEYGSRGRLKPISIQGDA